MPDRLLPRRPGPRRPRPAGRASSRTGTGPGALVLSLKAGGTGLNLTAASHVVLYDRWWNPAVEDQARDRAWRIGQTRTVVSHRLVCPGTVDERVEEVVAGKRHIADLVLPKSSSLADLDADQLRVALGLRPDTLLTEEDTVNAAPSKRRAAAARAVGASRWRQRGNKPRPLDLWRPVPAAARPRADRARRRPHACSCARSATRRCRARARWPSTTSLPWSSAPPAWPPRSPPPPACSPSPATTTERAPPSEDPGVDAGRRGWPPARAPVPGARR